MLVFRTAVREASNGEDLIQRTRDELGIPVEIADGEEEARFGFLGAVHGLPVEDGIVLDVRTRTVRQLTSVGRNEDPTWAPDSRHLAFVSDRSGYRQLWIIDLDTGRIRPLLQQSGARLPAWSPRLPETAATNP